MNNTSKKNSNEEIDLSQNIEDSDSEEKTSIDFLLDLILRRKKIFILTLIIFTFFSLIRTTREKIYNPIFKGEFSILINDPIKRNVQNLRNSSGGVSSIASNFLGLTGSDMDQDIPTLREVLLSDLVLKDIADKSNLKIQEKQSENHLF